MPCEHCSRPYAHQVVLVDGRQCCSWCPEWRHECEAATILDMPSLRARRAHLYGTLNQWGKLAGGIEQRRGKVALKALEATMTALWRQRSTSAPKG